MKRGMILLMGWLGCCQLYAMQYKTFEENGKVGMKDDNNQVVLPPSFEALGWSDGSFSVIGTVTGYRLKGRWGIINLKKEFVTKAEFENLVYAGGENIVVQKKISEVFRKCGCLNLRGEVKIPFAYDGVLIHGLRVIVFNLTKSGYQYGLVDLTNKSILPIGYKYIRPLGSLRYAIENEEGKIALFSEEGSPLTDFVFDSISNFYKGFAIVYQNHLQGLVDRDGTTKLETKYQYIKISERGKIEAQFQSEWKFINDKNETVQQIYADEIKPAGKKSYYIRKGDHWGVMNEELKLVIPILYEKIIGIEQERYLVRKNSKMGVIDSESKEVIPFLYDSLIVDQDKFRAYKKPQGWQMLDANGKVLTEHFYQQIQSLEAQNRLVKSKNYYGIINSNGKEFAHCVFDSIVNQVKDLIAVKFKGKYGIINTDEDWIVTLQDFPITLINQNRYLQKQPDNQFIKSIEGAIKYFTPYYLKFAKDYFTEVLPSGAEKIISYEGLIIQRTKTPDNTEEIFHESEGFVGIKKDGRYGFVNKKGDLRIANRYDSIGEFHEGLAPIKLIGRWGFVNTRDHIAINPNYDHAINFQDGLAVVSRNKKYGVINFEGKPILPLRYDNVSRQSNSFLLTLSGLKGLAESRGNVTIEPRFESLNEVGNDLLIVGKDGKFGVITNQGLNVIPMIYDKLMVNSSKNIFLAEMKSELKEIELK